MMMMMMMMIMMMMNCFCGMVNRQMGDPHHRESPTRREQDLNLHNRLAYQTFLEYVIKCVQFSCWLYTVVSLLLCDHYMIDPNNQNFKDTLNLICNCGEDIETLSH